MIGIRLTAEAMANALRGVHVEIVTQVAMAAAEGRVDATTDGFWAWNVERERWLAALEAAAKLYESLPPELLVVEAETLAPPPRPLTLEEKVLALREKARSIGGKT